MTAFDDFARRWLLLRKEELAEYMVGVILRGPMRRVPPKLRKVASALRTLRADTKSTRKVTSPILVRAMKRRAVKKGRRK